MRRFSLFLLIGILSLLLTGCLPPYTIVYLDLCNESGQTLYVETNIVSSMSSQLQSFDLPQGANDTKCIAFSAKENGVNKQTSVSQCITNDDAYLSIYVYTLSGEKRLVRKWCYTDRDKDERQPFNEKYLKFEDHADPDGGYHPTYTFIILPEDLE